MVAILCRFESDLRHHSYNIRWLMFNESCIFCKIIQGQIKSTVIKENDFVVAITDRSPKAPTHLLLIPKKHIVSFAEIQDEDEQYIWHLCKMARDLGHDIGRGFNLVSNNGADAGQSVFHLHLHFLAGKNIFDGGTKL